MSNENECMEYAQKLCDATTSVDRNAARKELRRRIKAAVIAERERICDAIKAEDDHCSTGDYMLDSNDCIAVAKGLWVRPKYD